MDPALRRAFAAYAALYQDESPLCAALCAGLGEGGSQAAADLVHRYFRILSTDAVDIPLFLGALHHLALSGQSPALASFFPSCGGRFDPAQGPALVEAAEAALSDGYEEVLDFMLSRQPVSDDPAVSSLVLLGAVAAVSRLGGPIALVEAGAGGGLRLLFDRYAYRFGPLHVGESPVRFELDAEGVSGAFIPTVTERVGLEANPTDLTNPDDVRFVAAFIPPDQPSRIERLQAAAALMAEAGRPDIRHGEAAADLAPLLAEVYGRMAPGTTLLLAETLHWSTLSPEEQKRVALAVQSLAAQIRPHKPIAWFQADRFTPGAPHLELRLHTFGWADPEDRAVIHLGEADPRLRWVRLAT